MSETRIFVAYLGLVLVAAAIGALAGAAAGRDARIAAEQQP